MPSSGGGLVESFLFSLDAVFNEVIPLAVYIECSCFEHGTRSGQTPVHSRAIHAVFHQVATRAFGNSTSDRITNKDLTSRVVAKESDRR